MPKGIYIRRPKQDVLNEKRNKILKNILPNVLVNIVEEYTGKQDTKEIINLRYISEFYGNPSRMEEMINRIADEVYATFHF